MKAAMWLVVLLCAGAGAVLATDENAGEENHGRQERLNALKTELKFEEWANKTREGREILVLQLDVASMLPADIESKMEPYEAPCPSWRVECSRKSYTSATVDMTFEARLLPDVLGARELLLRYIEGFTAPLSYLRKQWAKDKPPYGDVSFGRNLWSTGNLLFVLEDRDPRAFFDEVFSSIDQALMAWPEKDSEPIRADNAKGVVLSSTYIEDKHEWEITVREAPKTATILLCSIGWRARVPEEGTVRMQLKDASKKGPAYIVVIERGRSPRYIALPLAESESVEDT